jgi:hypothetical protein
MGLAVGTALGAQDEVFGTFLRVHFVHLYPSDGSSVRITAIVSDTRFTIPPGVGVIPSGAVLPGVATILLPPLQSYLLRFELTIQSKHEERRMESQQQLAINWDSRSFISDSREERTLTAPTDAQPVYRNSYKLYEVRNGVRLNGVRASIDYELRRQALCGNRPC